MPKISKWILQKCEGIPQITLAEICEYTFEKFPDGITMERSIFFMIFQINFKKIWEGIGATAANKK